MPFGRSVIDVIMDRDYNRKRYSWVCTTEPDYSTFLDVDVEIKMGSSGGRERLAIRSIKR